MVGQQVSGNQKGKTGPENGQVRSLYVCLWFAYGHRPPALLRLHGQHMEVPKPGIEPTPLQLSKLMQSDS